MTYCVSLSLAGIFIVSMFSVHAVIVTATVRELSNNNRLIVLHDNHKDSEEGDLEQLDAVVKALVDREKNTDRSIHILSESAIDQIRIQYKSVLCSLKMWLSCVDEPLIHTVVESIEIRKLSGAVGYILGDKSTTSSNEDLYLSVDNFNQGWFQGNISFNDLYNDFKSHQKSARKIYKNLLTLCGNENEKISIEKHYNCFMDEAKLEFIKYGDFLKENDIDVCSDQSIYKKVYDWDQVKRDQLHYLVVYCFSTFFNFNAYARIINIHKQNSSLDIVVIAGGNHCWRIETPLINTLPGEEVYYKCNETEPKGFKSLPLDLIYKLFQVENPVRETPCILPNFCTIY